MGLSPRGSERGEISYLEKLPGEVRVNVNLGELVGLR